MTSILDATFPAKFNFLINGKSVRNVTIDSYIELELIIQQVSEENKIKPSDLNFTFENK